MLTVEAILTSQKYDFSDWKKIVAIIAKQAGGLKPFSISIVFDENIVRLYFHSNHNLVALSSGLEGIILREVDEDETSWHLPTSFKKVRFLRIPVGGNVLDVRERYQVQQGKELHIMRIDVMRVGERFASKLTTVMKLGDEYFVSKQRLFLFPAHLLDIDIENTQGYQFATPPEYVSLEKTLNLLQTDETNALFSVSAFPYSNKDYYLTLSNYEFDKHSLIVGASGSGKSKLIQLLTEKMANYGMSRETHRIIIIDPHASLEEDLRYVPNSTIVNLSNESAQLFPDATADVSAATELTTTLFKSLLADQFNPKLERVLRFSVYVLLTAQVMSLDNIKTFLTDLDMRMSVLDHVKGFVPQNIQQFFATDFNELRTQSYSEAILPIVAMVDEMQLQPSLVGESERSLVKTITDNFLSVFSLNKMTMGEKAVKTVAGLLIQQVFLIAQSRVLPYKLVLIIDEVSVVQNPAIASILSEARKFNLSVIVTQQYFGQVDQNVKDAILSNVVNYYIFRVSEDDASQLEANIVIELPAEIIEKNKKKGLKESDIKKNLMTSLSPRECIVRIGANGQLAPAIKAKTVSIGSLNSSGYAASPPAEKPFVIKKLPEKMIIDTETVHAATSAPPPLKSATTADHPATEALKPLSQVYVPYEEPVAINIQQILADQSSSRENARERVTK